MNLHCRMEQFIKNAVYDDFYHGNSDTNTETA